MVSSFYFDKGDFTPVQQDALVLEVVAAGKNEDALVVVCDGIGGLKAGEYASSYVTMRIRNWFYGAYLKHRKKRYGRRRIEKDCIRMLYDCNRYLQCYGKEYGIKLGTTMTMVLLQDRRLFVKYLIFHVGDSRAYRIGKKCKRLTRDDSYGGRALYRCIGSFPWQNVLKRHGWLRKGENLLLCSDGFWRTLKEEELAESFGRKGVLRDRNKLSGIQLKKRLRKLGQEGRVRGERDNQAAVIVKRED
ncbi:MAG: serine/threonine-protein phosphatase [Lachnospiraceae bacterium]|nr:serine/threonine-protein phosphatase [Lachnospiraceae bacterium]